METGASTMSTMMDTVGDALVSGLTEAATGMINVIAEMLPVALAVTAAVLVISFGIKIFKKVTGR